MPPRQRRRQNNAAAGAAADGGAGAPPAQQPAQQSDVVRQDPPIFKKDRTREEFWDEIMNQEYARVPTTTTRRVRTVLINVWEVCGMKKTNRQSRIEGTIKKTIMDYIGEKPDDEMVDPEFSAQSVRVIRDAERKRICIGALKNVVKMAKEQSKGIVATFCFMTPNDVLKGLVDWKVPEITVPRFEGDEWKWLDDYIPDLKRCITKAGFTVQESKKVVVSEGQSDPVAGAKWELKISW